MQQQAGRLPILQGKKALINAEFKLKANALGGKAAQGELTQVAGAASSVVQHQSAQGDVVQCVSWNDENTIPLPNDAQAADIFYDFILELLDEYLDGYDLVSEYLDRYYEPDDADQSPEEALVASSPVGNSRRFGQRFSHNPLGEDTQLARRIRWKSEKYCDSKRHRQICRERS